MLNFSLYCRFGILGKRIRSRDRNPRLRTSGSKRTTGAGVFLLPLIFWLLPSAYAQPTPPRAPTPFGPRFGNGCQTQVICAAIERLGLYVGLRLDGTSTDTQKGPELGLGATVWVGLDLIRRIALDASFPVGVIFRGAESTLFWDGPIHFGARLRLGGAPPTPFSDRPQPRLAWVVGAQVTLPLARAAGDERHSAVLGAPQPEVQAAAEIRVGPMQLVPSLGALVAEEAVYLRPGGRLSLTLSPSFRADLEAQARLPLHLPDQPLRCGSGASLGMGLRKVFKKGVMAAAHYEHGFGDCEAAHRVSVGLTLAWGDQPLRRMPTPEEAGVERAWLGMTDPVLDCNGWMLDDQSLLPKFKFGDPDPHDPSLIRRGDEVFHVDDHFDIDHSGQVYRPHQYVPLADGHHFSEASTAEKLALPVCETGPKHRFFEHCQLLAQSVEKFAEAVQAEAAAYGPHAGPPLGSIVREMQFEEECLASEERQDPTSMFMRLLSLFRGRTRPALRPPAPPSPPVRKASGDQGSHPPPLNQGARPPASGATAHAGGDGVEGSVAGAGGGGSSAGGSVKPQTLDRTLPSRPPDPAAKPRGTPEFPKGLDEKQTRDYQLQDEAAHTLAQNGYDVLRKPPVKPNGKNPDYQIEGRYFDCYSPRNPNPRNIWREVQNKVKEGQADRIVVNLDNSSVDLSALREQFAKWPIENLREVFFIKGGKILSR